MKNPTQMCKACSVEANVFVQHRPTTLDATCWARLSIVWIILDDLLLEDAG